MPASVHAIVIARSGDAARVQLARALEALTAQSHPPVAITVVVTGPVAAVRGDGFPALVEGVIEARQSTTFAEGIELARPRVPDGRAVWLLPQDAVPEPDALAQLAGALERSPSAAVAAPKLVAADDGRSIVSLGVTMTRFGRTVELAAGELDQGQHDGVEDVLGADIRGVLVRAEVRDPLRLDTALGGADEGLDLGVRARLGGYRVVLAPAARVAVLPDGPAAPPHREAARAWAARRAQLHRRFAYAPAPAVALHWLSLLPLALWRSITHLIAKRPAAVVPEWGAAVSAMVRLRAVARSRAAIRAFRSASWSNIAPLRITRAELRRQLDDGHGSEGGAVNELRFFSGGGAWAVLAALVVGIAVFTPLLAWPALGGGALLPLRDTVAALWADAAWGLRGLGLDVVGPADPFAGVIAVLGTLWPGSPSFALVLLWLLALPLAVLGGWFAATRVTDRAGLRILGGVVWALAPTFLTALVVGRPAAVIVHLLLPWLFHAAVVAHRSWGAAGAASLFAAAVLASAPSLAPAVVLLWLLALVIVIARGWVRGAVRLIWVLIPSAVLFAPLVYAQVRRGAAVALLADPGAVVAGTQTAADQAGRSVLASGFPTADLAGWTSIAGPAGAWAPLLIVPLAVLALIAAISPRWGAGAVLLTVVLVGAGTAFATVGIVVSFTQGVPAAIWPGAGLSLAWIGLTGGALVALDTALTLPRVRTAAALVAGVGVAMCAVPALTAVPTGRAELTNGPAQTLPAFVAAQAGAGTDLGTLVLTPTGDDSLAIKAVWGASETLGSQTTLLSTATEARDPEFATLAVDLLSNRDFDAAGQIAAEGITFVLLNEGASGSARGQELQRAAVEAIDQRTGFAKAGETARGVLWRIEADVTERAGLNAGQQASSRMITVLQAVIVLAALLLSIPTRASRRAARAQSRIVGRAPSEPVAPPRARDVVALADAEARDLAADAEAERASTPGAAPDEAPETERVDDIDAEPDVGEPMEPEHGARRRGSSESEAEPDAAGRAAPPGSGERSDAGERQGAVPAAAAGAPNEPRAGGGRIVRDAAAQSEPEQGPRADDPPRPEPDTGPDADDPPASEPDQAADALSGAEASDDDARSQAAVADQAEEDRT